jgi:hypothetical protein
VYVHQEEYKFHDARIAAIRLKNALVRCFGRLAVALGASRH